MAEVGESEFRSHAKELVDKNFYMDDGLKSVATPAKAIDLLERTWNMVATANLRLHKIASSRPEVTQAFPKAQTSAIWISPSTTSLSSALLVCSGA